MRRRRRNHPRSDIGHKNVNRKPKYRTAPSLGRCEDCYEEVMFTRYQKYPHNWAPLDLRKFADANIRVKSDYYEICNEEDAANFRRQGTQMFKNHIIICPARGKAVNPS